MKRVLFFKLMVLFFSSPSWAQVLFEGYYRMYAQDQAIGYSVHKYENDIKTKGFKSWVFVKTNEKGGNITESIYTLSDENMSPLSFSYTGIQNGKAVTLDGKKEGDQMLITIKEGTGQKKTKVGIRPGLHFSVVHIYALLRSPAGLKPQVQTPYFAFTEETGTIDEGSLEIQNLMSFKGGVEVFPITNTFRKAKFISYVTREGEILEIQAQLQGLKVELMPNRALATEGLNVPEGAIKTFFGAIPSGEINIVSRLYKNSQWPLFSKENPSFSKEKGVPPGKGIHIKKGN